MTPSIDLDLVELRCKLRGWHFDRYNYTHRITVWINGASSIIIYANGKVTPPHKRLRAKEVDFLMSPRWTLERLLSEPPEGWISRPEWFSDCGKQWITWGGESRWYDGVMRDHEVLCRFGSIPERIPRHRLALDIQVNPYMTATGMDGVVRLAERHKAAAELALILAEVEP